MELGQLSDSLVAGSNALRHFSTKAFLSPNNIFLLCAGIVAQLV